MAFGMKFGKQMYKTFSSTSVTRNVSQFSSPLTGRSTKQFHTTVPLINARNVHCVAIPIGDPMEDPIRKPLRDPAINPYPIEFPRPEKKTDIGSGTMFFPHPYAALARFQHKPNSDGFFAVYLCQNRKTHEMGHFMCREFKSVREAKAHLNMTNGSLTSIRSPDLDAVAIIKIPLIYPRIIHRSLLENRLSQMFIKAEIENSE